MYSKDVENSDLKKTRQSVIEELEAINWYETRIEEAEDEESRANIDQALWTCPTTRLFGDAVHRDQHRDSSFR